ncbi:MAG TPA: peptidylprolyl isomerase [Casimicrobiaceae bacterium]|jgi:peptidyl-prolyl cis-trans isomerase C
MKRTLIVLVASAALASGGALAQGTTAAPAKAPAAKPAAPAKTLYTQGQFDMVLQQQLAQGGKDSAELRDALRNKLNTVVMLAREAKKEGLDKTPQVKTQLDLATESTLANAYIGDWLKKNPVPESDLHKEYDAIKAQRGDKEYDVRHILVDKESDAKEIIAELQKGAKFADLAKARSKDPGSKDKGGELGWNSPANFVKPFGDAIKTTPKGKFSAEPVHTQFGWHVIEVEDVRDAKFPTFDEVKPQLEEHARGAWIEKHIADLRLKNGV